MIANRRWKRGRFLPRFQGDMIFVRFLSFLTFAMVLAGAPVYAASHADSNVAHSIGLDRQNQRDNDDDENAQSQARARGIINGSVAGVDYAHGVVRVVSGRGVVDIMVLPGTGIVRPGNQYGTIADLVRGTRVAVYVSQVGGRLVAELIRIR